MRLAVRTMRLAAVCLASRQVQGRSTHLAASGPEALPGWEQGCSWVDCRLVWLAWPKFPNLPRRQVPVAGSRQGVAADVSRRIALLGPPRDGGGYGAAA